MLGFFSQIGKAIGTHKVDVDENLATYLSRTDLDSWGGLNYAQSCYYRWGF